MPVRILDWSTFGSEGVDLVDGTTVDTGGVAVTFGFNELDEDAAARNFALLQNVEGLTGVDGSSGLKLFGAGGEGGIDPTSTTTLTFASSDSEFGDEVQDVSFRINDLDLGQGGMDYADIVTVRAYDSEGNEVPVTLTPGSDILVSGNTATGNDIGASATTPPTLPETSLLVQIADPVARIEVEYSNGGMDEQAVWLTDVLFSTTDPFTGELTAAPDTIVTDEDTDESVIATDNDSTTGTGPLEITSVDTAGLLGTVTIGADGQTLTYDPAGQFESLGDGETANESFSYSVTDADGNTATSTVFVTINGLNDDPDAVDDSSSGIGTQTISVLTNDTDPEDDPLTVINTSSGTNGTTTINADGTVTYTPDEGFTGTDTFTYEIEDGNGGTDTATVTVEVLPCFTPGTAIATPRGERRVEDLQVGDRVITRDNGLQEIRWIGKRTLTPQELQSNPQLRPVLIRAGALGHGLPERDLLVSPQHRILMNSDRAALYFEEREVLAAAKHLTDLEGVDVVDTASITYIHFMFDQHEVVLSNGSWTESFQPGEQVMDGMGTEQRDEIYALFPTLRETEGLKSYQAARRSLKKHEARLLVK